MNHKLITNNKIVLHIDTSSNQEVVVSLTIDGSTDELREKIGAKKSQVVLPRIQELLEKHTLQLSDVTSITVQIGPGSFTGLRVGVAIANTLGTLLQVPINGQPVGKLAEPHYTS